MNAEDLRIIRRHWQHKYERVAERAPVRQCGELDAIYVSRLQKWHAKLTHTETRWKEASQREHDFQAKSGSVGSGFAYGYACGTSPIVATTNLRGAQLGPGEQIAWPGIPIHK